MRCPDGGKAWIRMKMANTAKAVSGKFRPWTIVQESGNLILRPVDIKNNKKKVGFVGEAWEAIVPFRSNRRSEKIVCGEKVVDAACNRNTNQSVR